MDCDLQEMKHFSPCNCASCDLWEKLYSREKNAYKTDKKVFFCRITCGRRKEVGIEGFCQIYHRNVAEQESSSLFSSDIGQNLK